MPLNAEERMRQAEYEANKNHYARLTPDQIKLNKVKRERDKLINQRDRVKGHIALYESHERSAGITLDSIRAVLR